jgi:raffinose/stachyose/melibiose transport system substrate-binding protein
MMYPDMFQIVFNTYGFNDVYQGSDNYRWLTDYQNGTGSLVGHMEPAVDKYKQLFEDGILSLNDWEVQPGTRSNMMYIYHTTAMVIESQNAMNYAKTFAESVSDKDVYHEVAMMPFWTSDKENSDYLYTIPNYFMAINKKSAEESDEKKSILLDILDYLSSVEGQQMLINGSPQISNVIGVEMDESAFTDAIRDTIERGQLIGNFYMATGENSKQVEKQLRSTTPDMIKGDMSVEDWLLAADQVRDDFLAGNLTQETVYGQVETTLTKLESAYTLAEMYQQLTGADIGIALGGAWSNGTNGHFYKGDITDSSLSCVTPNKESSSDDNPMADTIVTSTMTGAQILDILNNDGKDIEENGTVGEGRYYVASGLTVQFDPWASGSDRVISCKTADGKEIDAEATYQVAYFYGSLPEGSQSPETSLNQTWQESFLEWLDQQGGVIKSPDMTIELSYGEAK